MKNKFKKSKIIVPALALITATTVASVTGTVAWFTANRAVTVSAGNFIATKVESNLKVETVGGIGTYATSSNTAISTTETDTSGNVTNNKLTHGSYDAQNSANGLLYVAQVNDDGKTIDSFADLGKESDAQSQTASTSENKWLARSNSTTSEEKTTTDKIWYGVSWKMKFKLETASTNTTDYLFLDPSASTYTNSSSGTTTAPGFRIAFMTSSKFFVLGGDNTLTHCPATKDNDSWKYSDYKIGTNYQVVGTDVNKATDLASTATNTLATSAYNLGTINNTTDLEITCVAWYEGSDANVADTNSSGAAISMSDITASLSFYTRGIYADTKTSSSTSDSTSSSSSNE